MYCNLCKLGTHKKKIVDLTNYKMIIDHDQVLLTKVQLHALTQNVGLPGCLYIYIYLIAMTMVYAMTMTSIIADNTDFKK